MTFHLAATARKQTVGGEYALISEASRKQQIHLSISFYSTQDSKSLLGGNGKYTACLQKHQYVANLDNKTLFSIKDFLIYE